MEPGFVKKNRPAGPVQVITRMPKLRVPAPAAPGPLSDGTWIVATSPALPMSMPHTRSRYSVLAAALFTRRSPLPSPHAADDLHNWTICAPLPADPSSQAVAVFGDLRLLRRDRALSAITRRDSYRADWTAIAGSTFR
jgi:hypothetical protein